LHFLGYTRMNVKITLIGSIIFQAMLPIYYHHNQMQEHKNIRQQISILVNVYQYQFLSSSLFTVFTVLSPSPCIVFAQYLLIFLCLFYPSCICRRFVSNILHSTSMKQHYYCYRKTRSQAVARIADRTASSTVLWGSRDVIGHVII